MYQYETHAEDYWRTLFKTVEDVETLFIKGKVSAIEGNLIRAKHINAKIGTECFIGEYAVPAELISISEQEALLVSYDGTYKISVGDKILVKGDVFVNVGDDMRGRVFNGLGQSIDDYLKHDSRVEYTERYPLHPEPQSLLDRPLIKEQLITNIKVIDLFTPLGKGQRIGVFSGSGVGKSTLLGMLARHSESDINVIALIGERGREVKELIEYDIGPQGLKNTVLIVATSEESAAMRLRALNYACCVAEYFRDKGAHVTLMVDSFTRVAHAQREIGMMRGELPIARGFPTSIYKVLPAIVERCGTSKKGSITGIFTVLVEGDDEDEPVSDIVRGIVDGHILLNRELAQLSQYPAVHISNSISRLANKIQRKSTFSLVEKVRERLGLYEQAKDIINAGVYTPGANRKLDQFLNIKEELDSYLKQNVEEKSSQSSNIEFLNGFVERLG